MKKVEVAKKIGGERGVDPNGRAVVSKRSEKRRGQKKSGTENRRKSGTNRVYGLEDGGRAFIRRREKLI